MRRRKFLRYTGTGLLGLGLGAVPAGNIIRAAGSNAPDAVWVENGEPAALLQAAIEAYGGMRRFITDGDVVVIKPNIAWDRAPEFASTTNPELVAALVKVCREAGAKEVKVFDRTCNNPRRCYRSSRIEEVAKSAGADVDQVRDYLFTDISLANGEELSEWPIYRDYLEADKVINVPIAKVHSMSTVTVGLKNLMGVMGGDRGSIHNRFTTKLIDIDQEILPTLTIVDAYRVLMHNGPVGGDLADVKTARTLIMSDCTVTADALALRLFDYQMDQVEHIKEAYRRGLNKYALDGVNLKTVNLS
ncbi:MAG: DUF362 domain-containing protein [Candidatus Marinimicrobia bacterium]|nr:DUF362 domain-containing protein [Candidatus Neomarinimicrobiota bacterium]MCF7830300.1 DUF362 domain-containing protein [Candidatus Neomarinimicrobiota bacterium]MCF7882441.1 DUF362 domain-containing protein [Candidatus Neomarinimicrobiota bacterium]